MDDTTQMPEIVSFRASQKLLNLNKLQSSKLPQTAHQIPTIESSLSDNEQRKTNANELFKVSEECIA